jgi:hypothetical protein
VDPGVQPFDKALAHSGALPPSRPDDGAWASHLLIQGRCPPHDPTTSLGQVTCSFWGAAPLTTRRRRLGKSLAHSGALPLKTPPGHRPRTRPEGRVDAPLDCRHRGQGEGLTALPPSGPGPPCPPTRAENIARRVARLCRALDDWACGRPGQRPAADSVQMGSRFRTACRRRSPAQAVLESGVATLALSRRPLRGGRRRGCPRRRSACV